MIIEKPPTRIIVSGEYKDINVSALLKIMKELKNHPYHNYHFNDTIVIDSEHVSREKTSIQSNCESK
jgi:hypothetical protein